MKLKKLDVCLIITLVLIIIFIISMEVCFFLFQAIPDTLCTCVLGTGLGELIITGLIKIFGDKNDQKFLKEDDVLDYLTEESE